MVGVAEQAWEARPEVAGARLEVTEVAEAALRLTREVVAAVLVVVSHDLASNSETRISDHDLKKSKNNCIFNLIRLKKAFLISFLPWRAVQCSFRKVYRANLYSIWPNHKWFIIRTTQK